MALTLVLCEPMLCIAHCWLPPVRTATHHHGQHHMAMSHDMSHGMAHDMSHGMSHGAATQPESAAPDGACALHAAAGDAQDALLGISAGESRVAVMMLLALLPPLALRARAARQGDARLDSMAVPPPLRPPIPTVP